MAIIKKRELGHKNVVHRPGRIPLVHATKPHVRPRRRERISTPKQERRSVAKKK